jgi:hypothetical protein
VKLCQALVTKERIKADFVKASCSCDRVEIGLVKLVGDYGVLDQKLEGDDLEGGLVSGFEDDGTGGSGLLDLEPAGSADAPSVAGLEALEAELRHGCAEIVAESFGGGEEWGVDDAADGVDAEVVGAGLAATGAVEAGHGLATAGVERLAEDVFAAGLDWFCSWHVWVKYPTFAGEVRDKGA